MSQPLGSAGSSGSKDDRTMAMLAHLLGIITNVVAPLIIWLMKKDSSAFIGDNAREALNFQITIAICMVAASVISCIPIIGLVAIILWPLFGVVDLVFSIMGAVAASKGETYRYPVSVRLVN